MSQTVLVAAPVRPGHREQLRAAVPAGTELVFSSYAQVTPADARSADVIFGNISPALLAGADRLRLLLLNSAGADAYVKPGILPNGCRLTTSTGAYGLTVSEHALAMLMSSFRKLPLYDANQAARLWRSEGAVRSIEGSSILILGAGDIGCAFARKAQALGAYTIGTKRRPAEKPEGLNELIGFDRLEEYLPRADAVVICLPLTKDTRHLMDERRLGLMKQDAVLVNVGRGGIVDTDALVGALRAHRIGGACLDVTDPEPLPAEHPLWQCDNLILTPHVAGSFYLPKTLDLVVDIACDNLRRYYAGQPLRNLVR